MSSHGKTDRAANGAAASMSLDSPLLSGAPLETLPAVYNGISHKFQESGLREDIVADFRSRCAVTKEHAEPLRYDELLPPYPAGAIRLAILPIQPSSEQRASIVDAVTAVIDAVPRGDDFAYYVNKPEHWHITLFHTARLGDSRPDPFCAGGGVRASLDGPTAHPPPSEKTLAREVETFRAQAVKFGPITLQVHRVLMADSATLLLCCLDLSCQVQQLRSLLRDSLPGAPAQQTSILHISLARLAGGASAMTTEARGKVQAACDAWTERLHGQTFIVDQVHHVLEEQFSTVQGRRRSVFHLPQGPDSTDAMGDGVDGTAGNRQ